MINRSKFVDGRALLAHGPARRAWSLASLVPLVAVALWLAAPSSAKAEEDVWPELKQEVFGDRDITENDGAVTLFAPERAQDAALVPLSIRIPGNVAREVVALTVLIDRNPAPVAATFTFGDGYRAGPDVGERSIQTRIRLDSFSNVRAVLETADGRLHMSSRFVSGAGGCSAAPSKDYEAALEGLGRIDIKTQTADARGADWRETQVMVRHPNFTGLQIDPESRGYVPARFVDDLEVKSGGKMVLRMQGGISISENPHLRFSYGAAQSEVIEVRAKDTEGATFSHRSDSQKAAHLSVPD